MSEDGAHDPIMFEILVNALESTADEMALVLMRSAFSPVIRDTMDYSTALCDRHGEVVAQGLTLAVQLGAFPDVMEIVQRDFSAQLGEGDVLITNDPYGSGGQHLPDIYVIVPIFDDGLLVGYAATIAHHGDVGGIAPGSVAVHATSIHQEGFRIPLLKLVERGQESEHVFRLLASNSRKPDHIVGDIRAQLAACRAGVEGVRSVIERYGVSEVVGHMERSQRLAEERMRDAISALPDGRYRFSDYIDGLGSAPDPLLIAVEITVGGDEMLIDFEGTAQQVDGAINAPTPIIRSAAYCAVRSVLEVDIPNSQGYMRPIRISTPLGTIVNPEYPAACGARGVIAYRAFDAIVGALAQVVPDRVTAAGEGGPTLISFGGEVNGEQYVVTEVMVGCWGARSDRDGAEGVSNPLANLSNQPIELFEAQFPFRLHRYGLVPDSGGAGRYRGGLAFEREFEVLAGPAAMTVRADRRRHPPYGLADGEPGGPSSNELKRSGEDVVQVPTMPMEEYRLERGDVFRHVSAGGGGQGSPLDRDAGAVRDDVLDGKVSSEQAHLVYGVVFDGMGEVAVTETASERELRSLSTRR